MRARIGGMLKKRLPEAGLEQVSDPRSARGRRRSLDSILRSVIVGMVSGCKSLLDVEALTAEMAPRMRRRLGLWGRLPDTTARDVLCRLCPDSLRQALHRVVRAAQRRKALNPVGLPFGVVALDGKTTAIGSWAGDYAQYQPHAEGRGAHGALRTVTAALVSARARPCIDAIPIAASTNEMGAFQSGLRSLLSAYPTSSKLFEVITYDAGACSLANASFVVGEGLHYLFGLKESQPTLLAEARRLLAARDEPDAQSEDVVGDGSVIRRVFVSPAMGGFLDWTHLQTFVRIQSVKLDKLGRRMSCENRYYLSSLMPDRLSAKQWLRLLRAHWGVENNCHHTFDTAFGEDDKPWITSAPSGTLALIILRRIAYTLLALFRSVTQRAEEKRAMPWRQLMRHVGGTLIAGVPAQPTAPGGCAAP